MEGHPTVLSVLDAGVDDCVCLHPVHCLPIHTPDDRVTGHAGLASGIPVAFVIAPARDQKQAPILEAQFYGPDGEDVVGFEVE